MAESNILIIPEFDHRAFYADYARQENLAFEYNDFIHPDVLDAEEEIQRLVEGYLELGRDTSADTLHGAFLDVTVHSSDKLIRAISRKRVVQSMEIASRLGVRGVIFHTNFIPGFVLTSYIEGWLCQNKSFWKEILEAYPKQKIYMENMFDQDPELIVRFARMMAEEPRFGLCFDYAHARISKTSVEEWVKAVAPYVCHMHINDNDGIQDLHLPLGEGDTDWAEYQRLMTKYQIIGTVLLEVRGEEKMKHSLSYLKQKMMHPLSPILL